MSNVERPDAGEAEAPAGTGTRITGGGPLACPQHRFGIRELRGYLRLREAGGEVPEEVTRHLDECAACEATWEFLSRTDSLMAAHRQQRLGLIMREVSADEISAPAQTAALTRAERLQVMNKLKENLARVLEVPEPLKSDTPLEPRQIIQACDSVRSVSDVVPRVEQAVYLALRFRQRIPSQDRMHEFAGVLLGSEESTIDLTNLLAQRKAETDSDLENQQPKPDLKEAVTFIASLPYTSLVPNAPILDIDPTSEAVLFHPARLREAILEYRDLLRSGGVSAP